MFLSSSFTSSFYAVHFVTSFLIFLSLQLFFPVLIFLSFQLVHFIASVLSLQLFPAIGYFLRFASTFFHPFRYSFPYLSTLLFRPLLPPIVSTLPSCSLKFKPLLSGRNSSGRTSSSGNSSSQFVFDGQFVFGEFVFTIRLRGGYSSLGHSSSSSWNLSSQFVFGALFVFQEFVFAIRLRGGIRLWGEIRLRGGICFPGIRLRGEFVFGG